MNTWLPDSSTVAGNCVRKRTDRSQRRHQTQTRRFRDVSAFRRVPQLAVIETQTLGQCGKPEIPLSDQRTVCSEMRGLDYGIRKLQAVAALFLYVIGCERQKRGHAWPDARFFGSFA